MTNQSKLKKLFILTISCLLTLLLQGCGQSIDVRQTEEINGLIYKLHDNEPYSGKITNSTKYIGQDFNIRGELYSGHIFGGNCTLEVKKGMQDGTTICTTDGVKTEELESTGGINDGQEKRWDAKTGKLTLSLLWKNGQPDGIGEVYDSATGNVIFRVHRQNGVMNGLTEIFNPSNNKVVRRINYENGQSISEQDWDSSGETLLIDVTIKDGKKISGFDNANINGVVAHRTYVDGVETVAEDVAAAKAAVETKAANAANASAHAVVTTRCEEEFSKSDALSTVRFKAYGLKNLDADKASIMKNLEKLVSKDLNFFYRNVEGKAATVETNWVGDLDNTKAAIGPSFGYSGKDNSDDGWNNWFGFRFMPVYLKYATAIENCAVNNKDSPTLLVKPQELFDAALAMSTAQTSYSGRTVAVWESPSTPWPNYALNADPKSVESNLQALKRNANDPMLSH